MSLKKSLDFAKGGVGKSKADLAMKHFKIHNGRVTGTNGIIALSAPLPIGFDCQPEAVSFIKAIDKCGEKVSFTKVEENAIRVSSGRLRVTVPSYPQPLPSIYPEGVDIAVNPALLIESLDKIHPFICHNGIKPWANGALIRNKSIFATNNIVLIEAWLASEFPHDVNIPSQAIDKLLSIKSPFTRLQISNRSITFHFDGDMWMKCALLSTEWPDMSKVFERKTNPVSIPEGLKDAIEQIKPFKEPDSFVYLACGTASTNRDTNKGASVEVPGIEHSGKYKFDAISSVLEVADKIDFSCNPAYFTGKMIRGVLVGMRD